MTNWQTKKLGDAMEFIPTGSHSRNDMTIATGSEEEVLNIHYGDIHTKYSTYVDCEEDSVSALKENNIRAQMLLKDGDLVVADASEDYDGVGSSVELRNVSDRKVIGGLHTFALRSKNEEFASGFTGLMLKNPATRKRLMQMSVYSKVYGLTKSSISSVDVSYPEKPEQERIVRVLEVWDEYIEKLEQKIALKEQLKKGLMQQLLTGKRRLPGFSDGWQMTTVGSLGRIVSGGTPDTSKSEYWGGEIDWITPTEITKIKRLINKPTKKRITNAGLRASSTFVLPPSSLVLCSRATIGECAINETEITTNQGFKNIIPNRKVDAWYLYYWIKQNKKLLLRISSGSTFLEYSKKDLERLKINLPGLDEQLCVARVLKNIDKQIENYEAKKILIESQKKYLLKNLITGTIRTPEDLQLLDASRLERSAL